MILKLDNYIMEGVYCTNNERSYHICHNVVHFCLLVCHKKGQMSELGLRPTSQY